MIDLELIKLMPGGGQLVALVILVVLFLRQQRATDHAIQRIADRFTTEFHDAQTRFAEQLMALSRAHFAGQRHFQSQVKQIIDDHVALTRETVTVVRSLDATVRGVEQTLRTLNNGGEPWPEPEPEPAPEPQA